LGRHHASIYRRTIPGGKMITSEIRVCTVASYGALPLPPGLHDLTQSCANHSIHLSVFGIGEPFVDFMETKIRRLRHALTNLKVSPSHILFVDGNDTLVMTSLEEIHNKFLELASEIVISTEDNCWPDLSLAAQYPQVRTKNRYLNSGGIYGTFDAFVRALEIAESYGVPDDQWCWTKAWLDGRVSLTPDYHCTIFQSLRRSECDMDYNGPRIRNISTGTEPSIFHGNGGADMSRVREFIFSRSPTRAGENGQKAPSHVICNVKSLLPEAMYVSSHRGAFARDETHLRQKKSFRWQPAGFIPTLATKRQTTPAFGITIVEEGPELLSKCLRNVRSVYPQAPIFVISDGHENGAYPAVCRANDAMYHLGICLKLLEHGAEWWHRLFLFAARCNTDFVFNLDPNALLHRRFRSYPRLDVFGSLDGRMIQGGIQGFSAAAISKILLSGMSVDSSYRDYRIWAIDEASTDHALSTGHISTDYLLFHIIHRLGLRSGEWSEVDSMRKKSRPFREGVAATYPHKLEERR
jgi:hypothetical protein